jgi:hypothetical protein
MGNTQTKDMAICIAIFNPAKTKRIIMNYNYMVNILKMQGLPVFTIELVFGNESPEIPDSFVVRGNSYMFHKERLYRILEKTIPFRYKKLALLDGDILFDDKDWYSKVSKLLDTHDVVQPFAECHWLDLTYTQKTLTRKSVLFMNETVYSPKYHPGFAWCFRRDWYNKIGTFDYALSGSGDSISAIGWLKKEVPRHFKSIPSSITEEFNKFYKQPSPRITYLEGEISHLYHGARSNRQYVERHSMLELNRNIKELISINKDGVYEWFDPTMNIKFYNYFVKRYDDDLSELFVDVRTS